MRKLDEQKIKEEILELILSSLEREGLIDFVTSILIRALEEDRLNFVYMSVAIITDDDNEILDKLQQFTRKMYKKLDDKMKEFFAGGITSILTLTDKNLAQNIQDFMINQIQDTVEIVSELITEQLSDTEPGRD